ncbi:hypothetical protein LshimejAT787_0500790 [Lyophyllum shimeji]|uniref:Homeobox domain-containing protein n=1 Tax=Lyophyllum shimeji TaxID=47721 RepID=A0A9P3UKK5_LYOSH|nr:hypothetical protein LshimejAT787_0500790 [Lyophyllum shimeji]
MDVNSVPEPKTTIFQRANAEQLKVLKAAFAASNVTAKHSLSALSEATGLTQKWISSWFTRERKKNVTAAAKRAAKGKTMATPMTIAEITAFKTEHHDSALPLASHGGASDTQFEQKPIISTDARTKTAGNPRRKGNNDPQSHAEGSKGPKASSASASRLKSPFSSAPLAPRTLATSPLAHEPLHSAEIPSSTSRIPRSTVPLLCTPCSSLNLPVASGSHATPDRTITTAPSTSTTVSSHNTSASSDIHKPNTAGDVVHKPQHGVIPRASAVSQSVGRNCQLHTTATLHPHRGPLRPTEPSVSKKVAQPQNQDRNRNHPRPLRPLLPLYIPPSASTHPTDLDSPNPFQLLQNLYAPPLMYGPGQSPDDRSVKENKAPPSHAHPPLIRAPLKPPASGLPALKPLFSYDALSLTTSAVHQQVQRPVYPPRPGYPTHPRFQPQIQAQQYHLPQPVVHTASSAALSIVPRSLQNYDYFPDPHASVLDPTSTPLKHLNVLPPPPFTSESLLADDMVHRLLDGRLTQEDPFQAAMGLVLVSRLGMTWEMC